EEGLGLGGVLKPGEGVVPAHVTQLGLIHLPSQPFATVDANVDMEGKPGLDARVHETENRVDLIVIQMQTLARTVADLQLPGQMILDDLEGHARIDAAQDADGTFLDAAAGGDCAGDVSLANRGA